MATRLRRSLRGAPATKVTKQDMFERLIKDAYREKGHTFTAVARHQFFMSSLIVAQQHGGDVAAASRLETLPTDVLVAILENMTGNEQIMVALASKTLARVVETSSTRKIANIDYYRPPQGASEFSYRAWPVADDESGPPPAKRRALGYLETGVWSSYQVIRGQYGDLRDKVGGYLGKEYRFCSRCSKYRLLNPKWWQEFVAFEGLLKDDRGTYGQEMATKNVKRAISMWNQRDPSKPGYWNDVCPAHDLLAETRGQRTIWTQAVKEQTEKDEREKQEQEKIKREAKAAEKTAKKAAKEQAKGGRRKK